SNDTLFIQLTATPTASAIPTALNIATRFKKGDQLTLVNANLTIQLPKVAGSTNALNMSKSLCFRNARALVQKVGKRAVNPNYPIIYYEVQCPNVLGWVPEYRLTPLGINDSALVTAGDGAKIFSSADTQTDTGSVCASRTVTQVHEIAANSARNSTDTN